METEKYNPEKTVRLNGAGIDNMAAAESKEAKLKAAGVEYKAIQLNIIDKTEALNRGAQTIPTVEQNDPQKAAIRNRLIEVGREIHDELAKLEVQKKAIEDTILALDGDPKDFAITIN